MQGLIPAPSDGVTQYTISWWKRNYTQSATGSSDFICRVLTLSFTKEFIFLRQWNSRWIPTLSGSDLAGLTLNIFDMSSELRCWATSHSLAVMSIRLQMSMSTRLAFSWILVSRSDISCRGKDGCFRWQLVTPCTHGARQLDPLGQELIRSCYIS